MSHKSSRTLSIEATVSFGGSKISDIPISESKELPAAFFESEWSQPPEEAKKSNAPNSNSAAIKRSRTNKEAGMTSELDLDPSEYRELKSRK